MSSQISTVAAGSPQVDHKPIYAVCCNLHSYTGRNGESWYRITILRGYQDDGSVATADCEPGECTISDLSIPLGRRLLTKLADRYGVKNRAGLFAGSLVAFALEGGAR